MSHSPHIRFFSLPGVEQSTVENDQIAYISVVELPFRINISKYFRFHIGDDNLFEIAGYNRYSLPDSKNIPIDKIPLKKDSQILNTRIAIIEHPVTLNKEDINEIRQSKLIKPSTHANKLLKEDPGSQIIIFPQSKIYVDKLRQFIELYYINCPPRYFGHNIRPLWEHDFYERHIVFSACLVHKNGKVPDSFLKVLLQSENPRLNELHIGVSLERNITTSDKNRLAKALKHEVPSLADSLWILADSYAGHQNQEMATITAVASLEAAVNIYTRTCIEPKLGRSLTEQLLRDQGMFVLIQVLPKLFFPPEDIPSEETSRLVLEAITARNALMHGKHDKSGKPTFFTKGHLGKEIYACGEMKKHFEKQTKNSQR